MKENIGLAIRLATGGVGREQANKFHWNSIVIDATECWIFIRCSFHAHTKTTSIEVMSLSCGMILLQAAFSQPMFPIAVSSAAAAVVATASAAVAIATALAIDVRFSRKFYLLTTHKIPQHCVCVCAHNATIISIKTAKIPKQYSIKSKRKGTSECFKPFSRSLSLSLSRTHSRYDKIISRYKNSNMDEVI